ncbi:acyl-CoA oxidase domain protein [Mycobacterium xenopi 4042]|uniref:Acyl-CoA oxidase domain protein n=1 Tax=Mycobacterium xenopi 4042 TaxID=1299334 RepID=X8ANC9_MYCXE|nr:acyl-CoA oxidase domain protein [Mycobacterium xenopi 4042]
MHCFLVPIRDAEGNDLPGVTTSDCDYKGGLPGVDNGRIVFDQVRIPRENLLNRYGDVAPTEPTARRSKTPTAGFSPCSTPWSAAASPSVAARPPPLASRWTSRPDTRCSASSSAHPTTTAKC